MSNNDDNKTNKQPNVPIDGVDPSIQFEKGRLAYEKLVKEGRLGEYEKYVELLQAKELREKEEEELNKNRPKIYKCTKCNQIGEEGRTCKGCGDKQSGGGVYGGHALSGDEFAQCFDMMIEEEENNKQKK